MANTLLTPTQVLREALRVLHNNLVFVKNVNKQYGQEFAVSGAKVGATINVRLPNRYYVTKSTHRRAADDERKSPSRDAVHQLPGGPQLHQAELTLSLDDFFQARARSRYGAAGIARSTRTASGSSSNVFNQVGTPGTTPAPRAAPSRTRSSTTTRRRSTLTRA